MLFGCFLLLICGIFLGIYSLKNKYLFPLLIKSIAVFFIFMAIYITISKVSHYQTNIAIDNYAFRIFKNSKWNLFFIAIINNIGITIYSLASIIFVILVGKKYKSASVFSVITLLMAFLNHPATKESIYITLSTTTHSSYMSIETATLILKILNVLFLFFIVSMPYISLFAEYSKEIFIRRKRSFRNCLLVYFANDIWVITLLFASNLKSYFYLNHDLLCYPLKINIVSSGLLSFLSSFFIFVLIIAITNVFFPWVKILGKYSKNNQYDSNLELNISMLLHDVKNTFTTIAHYSNDEYSVLGSDKKSLKAINEISLLQVESMTSILKSLKASSTKAEKPSQCDIDDCIKQSIKLSAINSRITLTENYLSEPPYVCMAHTKKLTDCFISLINNAVEALGDTPNPKLAISIASLDKKIYIDFRDNGCGIEDTAIVFKPFYSTKKGKKNFGIGLTATKKYIKSCGGHIDILCKQGFYTSVQIELPLYNHRGKEKKTSWRK